ncbi:MAG TPA: TIGR04282 family arsenosugar biosynthesis glycosyltransferase [Hyphomicrobiaceae bacterium]|nr:TIGR04282 family arsenosugar biosynthesis glycosyltransferase [Hyphomicrobiaceae bacterium]
MLLQASASHCLLAETISGHSFERSENLRSKRVNEGEASMIQGVVPDLRSACAIAVMAKASTPGRTKTRLVPPLTHDEAAMLNTAFLRDTADNILSAAALADVRPWVAYAPAGSEAFFRAHLPEAFGLIETGAPTLGDCLGHAAAMLLGAGHDAVCLINSDSPTLPVAYLVMAATALAAAGDRIVLGPATDGGYYLIGMKRLHAGLFEDIAWSTDRVFIQTLERAQTLGLLAIVLPTWYDVDSAMTLETLVDEVLDGKAFRRVGTPAPATWTRKCLVTLVGDLGLRARMGTGRALDGPS